MASFDCSALKSPDLYPQKYDPGQQQVLMLRMTQADYRAASFLDDRVLTPGCRTECVAFAMVADAVRDNPQSCPLHFIFHSGHVGSTLLSRLVEEVAPVLSLREPLPLRTLADIHDVLGSPGAPVDAKAFAERLEVFLRLWSRGYQDTQAVILKATSSTGRLAPALLAARPSAKAVYLNLAPEPYLATLLAGANAVLDLKAHAPGRMKRLEAVIGGAFPVPRSVGELAAMSWLAERFAQARATAAAPGRVIAVDFDDLLARLELTMAGITAHLELDVPAARITELSRSPVLSRYSKAPEHAYSPALRAQLLVQARREHGGEMRRGFTWLQSLAGHYQVVGSLLGRP